MPGRPDGRVAEAVKGLKVGDGKEGGSAGSHEKTWRLLIGHTRDKKATRRRQQERWSAGIQTLHVHGGFTATSDDRYFKATWRTNRHTPSGAGCANHGMHQSE